MNKIQNNLHSKCQLPSIQYFNGTQNIKFLINKQNKKEKRSKQEPINESQLLLLDNIDDDIDDEIVPIKQQFEIQNDMMMELGKLCKKPI